MPQDLPGKSYMFDPQILNRQDLQINSRFLLVVRHSIPCFGDLIANDPTSLCDLNR